LELSPRDKSRTRYHLGMNVGAGIPAGDMARLEEAMARLPDEVFHDQVIEHLNRCDRAYAISEVYQDSAQPRPSRIDRITGDQDRAIYQTDPLKAAEVNREIYVREVDNLAETLCVANYRRAGVRRYMFDRSGGEFISAVPGVAEPSVDTRVSCHIGSLNWR
jgi:hypothetical protein